MATTYLENQETDAFGNMVRDTRGGAAAMQMFRQYDPLTGHLSEICAGSDTVSCQIMRDRYVWDSVGNLNWRDRKDYGEDFWYDSVDRLQVSRLNRAGGTTYAYGSGQITDWADYDKLGNVCAHWMRGSQSMGYFYAGRTGCGLNGSLGGTYNSSLTDSPHQVRQTSAYSSFVYDSHGNQTFADSATSDSLDRTIRYNAQDQAYEILKGPVAAPSRTARFWYDPSGSRYKREDTGVGIVGTRRTLYVGNLEIVSENGTTTYKRYIGGVLVQNVVNGIAANRYLFQDHLGSTVAVTNEAGTFIEGGGFNAFGERRTNGSATGITTTGLSATTRGFTGHEMLDDGLDVIHMNGRIYDPTLGRFLQADPVIQNTSTPQAWNAYTYVFNNPYRYTDPTGMIGVEERQWLAMAVTIAATWYAPQVWGAAYAAAGGAAAGATAAAAANAAVVGFTVATGAVAGGISGGSNGAVMGAFSALAFYGVGQAFSGMQGAAGTGFLGSGFTSGEFAAKVLTHGIAGGVMAELQGGKFGNGFVSAAGAEFASPFIDKIGGGDPSYAGARVAVAALIGGTVSALTGGKFASGALTAAFSRAFNEEVHQNYGDWPDDYWFDPKEETYHAYTEVNAVCYTSERGCSLEKIGGLMLEKYTAISKFVAPHPPAAPGEERLLYASLHAGMDLPLTYTVPGGVIRQVVNDRYLLATNFTTKKHPLYPGLVNRIVVESEGRIWLVTHGVGCNHYARQLGAFANQFAGPLLFRDLDKALIRDWRKTNGY